MARTKRTPFNEWESRKADGIEKRYIRLGASKAASMIHLSDAAYRVFLCMMMESAGKREFEFPYSKYKAFAGKHKFLRVKQELIEQGFIEEVENNSNRRLPNIYCFSERWKQIIS